MLRILEVGIGLALVFTLVALICSIINEWISAIVEKRGNLLWEGIENLVDSQLRDDICNHQLMQGLVRKSTWADRLLKKVLPGIDRSKPSYVPTKTFVTALLDAVGARAAGGDPAAIGQLPTTFKGLQEAIEKAQGVPPKVQQALLALVNNAESNLDGAKKQIGDWFDAGMDRVTGWYKRWSQLILLLVSLIVAVTLGVDSFAIAKRLWTDQVLREAMAETAKDFVEKNRDDERLQGPPEPTSKPRETPTTSDGASTTDTATTDEEAATTDAVTSEAPPVGVTSDETPVEGETASAGGAAADAKSAEDLAKEKLAEIQIFQDQLEALTLPLFPPTRVSEEYEQKNPDNTEASWAAKFCWWLWNHWFGFLLTSLAASLGAPFWFDVLNKFVNLRTTGKKPEEPAPAKPPAAEPA
jgi:cytoskeletal protein RodZ